MNPAGFTRWGLGLLLIMPMVWAAEEVPDDVPSLDFLEFLGEWEDEQGNWQGPLDDEIPEDRVKTQVPDTKVERNDEVR
ncbi:hypothetical protein MNBD_GAMMA14-1072 [hydrothermal vent metagenome]|uniref:Uncharacterized protein n=1 Tax=hydrothermal vent metagenome TaxID=652676 RepID=A0A3B0YEY9_9ZZZZ